MVDDGIGVSSIIIESAFRRQSLFATIGPVIGFIKSKVLLVVLDSRSGPILVFLVSFEVEYLIVHSCQILLLPERGAQ